MSRIPPPVVEEGALAPISKPRTLVLLRHGQTAWNLERRIQGQTDAELDETGHAQARAAAKEIAALRPGLLWTSDLSRASETASYVAEACGLESMPDPRLREYALGQREGLLHTEYAAAAPEEFEAFRGGDFDVVLDGEKTPEVASRMLTVIGDLRAATAPGGLSVAVTHGAAMRVGLAAVLGWDLATARTLGGVDNCGWAVLRESPATGEVRLAAYNRTVGI